MKSWVNSLILNESGFSFKSLSVREQVLLIQSNNDPLCSQLIARPKAAVLLLRDWAALLADIGWWQTMAMADVGCYVHVPFDDPQQPLRYSPAGHVVGQAVHGLLVSNEWNFRNLQVERDQLQRHYLDVAIRSSEGFQGRW